MKIACTCGHHIIDQTDGHTSKGHILPDTQWHPFWDQVDAAIERSGASAKEKEVACMHLRRLKFSTTMWECSQCGRLYVEDGKGRLITFAPEAGQYQGVLNRSDK